VRAIALKRRELLRTLPVVGAAASLTAATPGPKIDLHNHYHPETYFQMIRDLAGDDYTFDTDAAGTTIIKFRGARFFGIQPPMTDVSLRLEAMERVGIDVQVLSVSVPNVYFASVDQEPEIAHGINNAYAELIARYPQRFKGFASVPMSLPTPRSPSSSAPSTC